ncbi:hypothetical protein [Telmatospirillum sp.]|uniref:hypothetical protein n=1 Tax=Telmatospirillum sp. TaxID=2079197 RepID=UPI0028473598|nr:hypothetical protein [Telmatospirillum sp.]MDR3436316.1 hypothetical protein [Telmatospirillum sp.]
MLEPSEVQEYLRCATLDGALPELTGEEIGQLIEAAKAMRANLDRLGEDAAAAMRPALDAAVELLEARQSGAVRP